jgi:hypothetical protein
VEVLLDIGKEGRISGIHFYGDFFSGEDPAGLAAALVGCSLERGQLSAALRDLDVSLYFRGMTVDGFLSLLLG